MKQELEAIEIKLKKPKTYDPGIALIGCNAITNAHLGAYRDAGYRVLAFCDLDEAMARDKRDRFYPDAVITTQYDDLLQRDDIEIFDIATMPQVRAPLMEKAILAGKHVLSQKPFVVDIETGQQLIELANKHKRKIAVNQNARFATFWLFIQEVIERGILGEITQIDFGNDWEYKWLKNRTDLKGLEDSILEDYAIHWFDLVATWLGERKPSSMVACYAHSPEQTIPAPLMAKSIIQYPKTLCQLSFNGDHKGIPCHSTRVTGTQGVIEASGSNFSDKQKVVVSIGEETYSPKLTGGWFNEGLHGTMTELMLAIEEDREPSNSGLNNLKTIQLTHAAVESARTGKIIKFN